MKMRISKNNLASFLCGGVVCLTACISMSSNDVEKVIESRPVVSSMTLSPDVPSSVPFCGKLIDITRYDMREAYDRELSSFTYFHSTTMLLIKRANRYFPAIWTPVYPLRLVLSGCGNYWRARQGSMV